MSVHVATLLLGHVIHVASGADLVIRIPGGGQPQDGFYRLDYRWVLYDTCKMFDISRVISSSPISAIVRQVVA